MTREELKMRSTMSGLRMGERVRGSLSNFSIKKKRSGEKFEPLTYEVSVKSVIISP